MIPSTTNSLLSTKLDKSITTVTSSTVSPLASSANDSPQTVASVAPAEGNISISNFSARLSRASEVTEESNKGLNHNQLSSKLLANQLAIGYELTAANKESYGKQVPKPGDPASIKSAADATAFVSGAGANPFAGLSREQLSTITNDESGTFTVNEKRAAYTQAYNEEEAWGERVARASIQEYRETGKATNFFKEVLAHFEGLPKLEQALHPENYAEDLAAKIKLDFNYFTNSAGDASPSTVSLANTLGKSGLGSGSNNGFDPSELIENSSRGRNRSISS